MDKTQEQKLKEQFDILPAEVQKAITTLDLSAKLQEIVKNNKLMIDQAGKLEIQTLLVLFGIEPIENYTNNLTKKVGLSNIQTSVVAHDVNEIIFKNIRESLKKMSNEMLEAKKETAEKINNPTKESILAGIEQPENIKNSEESLSMSDLKSNTPSQEIYPEMATEGIEIRVNNLPEIAPEIALPAISSLTSKPTEPFHQNISPVNNIVESKLNSTVIVPKENIIIEEKTKIPERNKSSGDPYRESII